MLKNSSKKGQKRLKLELSDALIYFGSFLIIISVFILVYIFYPVVKEEFKYQVKKVFINKNKTTKIKPKDTQFGIVIPKINANAKIIANVDPFNEKEYQYKLTQGIAHAQGTVFPGNIGNVFLFAHSSANFYEANRFNSVFYLIDKLTKGDEIFLYYKGEKFKYLVTNKKIVEATDIQYLKNEASKKTVVLMTCWPAGTTLKRLIVIAEISNNL